MNSEKAAAPSPFKLSVSIYELTFDVNMNIIGNGKHNRKIKEGGEKKFRDMIEMQTMLSDHFPHFCCCCFCFIFLVQT